MSEATLTNVDAVVHPVDLGISDELNSVVRAIVRNKHILDAAVSDQGAAMLARDLHDGDYGPHEPMPFLHKILPFPHAIERSPDYRPATVPTANAIGCSWNWRKKHLDENQAATRREKLSNTVALLDGSLDTTAYCWIKPLGLIVPSEGKNRVDFFREEGIDSIPADINECTYPTPDRIAIYNVEHNGFKATWAVLDGRWVENVPNPSWTLPLMTAYGARTARAWPSDFPKAELVVRALFEPSGTTTPLGHPDFGDAVVVDLETIRARAAYQSEVMPCAGLQLNHTKIDPRLWLISGALSLVSLLAMGLSPDSWTDFQIAAGILFGASFSAGFFPTLAPIFRTQRRNLDHQLQLPLELAPKNDSSPRPRYLG